MRWVMLLALLVGVGLGRAHAKDEPAPGPTCACDPACKSNQWCRLKTDSTCACEDAE